MLTVMGLVSRLMNMSTIRTIPIKLGLPRLIFQMYRILLSNGFPELLNRSS